MGSISHLEIRINRFIGAKLRQYRMAQKISLASLAAMLDISYQQLQKYETGANRISAAKLIVITHALGMKNEVSFHDVLDSFLPELIETSSVLDEGLPTKKLAHIDNDFLRNLK